MTTVLKNIAKKEKFHLTSEVATKIIEESNGNLRKAILVFEALKMQSYVLRLPFPHGFSQLCVLTSCFFRPLSRLRPTLDSDSLETAKPDWETFCIKVADSILAQQDPERLLEVRGRLYELMSHCIPPVLILKVRLVSSRA
jgi:replication factor C subunit 3/5